MTIHYTDPFATPEPERSPVRRLRGRLTAPVTLWTAPGPAGLTVSSVLIADGDPGQVLGLIDDESQLWEAVSASGRFAVCPLLAGEQQLADQFGGLAPAPGGPFATGRWRQTHYGPIPDDQRSWAGCELTQARRCGWAMLVEGTLAQVVIGTEPGGPLSHYRGRYLRPSQ